MNLNQALTCGFEWVIRQQGLRGFADLDAPIWAGGLHAASSVPGEVEELCLFQIAGFASLGAIGINAALG